jgi:hypothetical protein
MAQDHYDWAALAVFAAREISAQRGKYAQRGEKVGGHFNRRYAYWNTCTGQIFIAVIDISGH